MKRYFDTREAAERHLEWRRKCAYDRIEKRKDKILIDNSHVYKNCICVKDGENTARLTDIEKWFVWMDIITQQMINDLHNISIIDREEELRALVSFTEEEKKSRHDNRLQNIEKYYKTIDKNDDTINKPL